VARRFLLPKHKGRSDNSINCGDSSYNLGGDKMKCAIYTRVSTDNQAEVEFNSCEAQEAKIKSFVNSQENMAIYKVYSDPGFTGANLNRPALQEMFEDIKQGHINLVIAYKIDRLTRSPKDFYHLIEIFEDKGVDFLSVTERFDTSTPSGRLLRNIMLTFAQFERELSSERTRDKMVQRHQKGMWNGGTLPFGYKVENKKLLIDEEQAKLVRRLYGAYLDKQPLAEIYTELKKSYPLTKSRIYTILRNPLYIGKIKYASKINQGNHEAIISDEVFELAQKMHCDNKRTMSPYKNYAFAGLINCKECGSSMTPCHTNKKTKSGRTKRYYYYRCVSTFNRYWDNCQTRQINATRLERYVIDNLRRISLDKQYIDNLVFRLNSSAADGRIGLPGKIPVSSKNPGKNEGMGDRTTHELRRDPPTIFPKIVVQTLDLLVKSLLNLRGIEKNLLAKKFIKSIIYSIESIEINFRFPAGGNKKACQEMAGQKVCNMKTGSLFRSIPIILPNEIHHCKKRNLL